MIAPAFPIRLIALDIDGTMIDDDLEVGPRTRAAIRAALDRDVAVSLVTGRMVSSAMRFARDLGLREPVVGYQGGLIRAMPDEGSTRLGKLMRHSPLPADAARDIIEWTRATTPGRRTTRRSWATPPSSCPISWRPSSTR